MDSYEILICETCIRLGKVKCIYAIKKNGVYIPLYKLSLGTIMSGGSKVVLILGLCFKHGGK